MCARVRAPADSIVRVLVPGADSDGQGGSDGGGGATHTFEIEKPGRSQVCPCSNGALLYAKGVACVRSDKRIAKRCRYADVALLRLESPGFPEPSIA